MRKPAPPPIHDAFQNISASTRSLSESKRLVPTLVVRGSWLKAIGIPIGTSVLVSTDKRGELTLARLGLRPPRRLRIVGNEGMKVPVAEAVTRCVLAAGSPRWPAPLSSCVE